MAFTRTKLLCYATLPDGYSFAESIAAASRAGFRELSLWLMTLDAAREELGSLEAVKALLDEYDMRPTSLELLSAWPNATRGEHMEQLEGMMAAAEVFQPELVMAGCLEPELDDRQRAIANLREICREVSGTSFKLGLEFLPWSALPDIPSVRGVVEDVGEDILGYVLDTWHFVRAGSDYDALAQLPGDRVRFIQASDARPLPGPDLLTETLGDRVGPDDGVLDWPRMLDTWRRMGVDCPIGTEMFSDRVKAMALDDACRYLYDCLQQPFLGAD